MTLLKSFFRAERGHSPPRIAERQFASVLMPSAGHKARVTLMCWSAVQECTLEGLRPTATACDVLGVPGTPGKTCLPRSPPMEPA